MKEPAFPFQFDFRDLTNEAKRRFGNRVGDVTISLPFLSFSVKPTNLDKEVAREITIRLKNRRVLDSRECCDNCIDEALGSLQSIRGLLVDQQVKLSHATQGPLYLVSEYMLESIRQFLTFKQKLDQLDEGADVDAPSSFRRQPDIREKYFAALEMLRGHLNPCRVQVAAIADVTLPDFSSDQGYKDAWQIEAYEQPALHDNPAT